MSNVNMLVLALALAGAAATGCSDDATGPRRAPHDPTTIEWRNRDPLAHTVTRDVGAFDSGELRPESGWSHTFTTPGTYTYHCTPHPHMKATVVVRANS